MIRKRLVSPLLAAAAFAVFLTGVASAQELNTDQRTYFTFSAPVALPGVTLPAGKYTFRLATSQANRHIVQVFNEDGSKIFATLFAIPAERNEVPNDPEIQFLETPADAPAAIDVWWFPGTKTGHEFVYPKDSATKMAKAKDAKDAKTLKGQAAPASMTFANADADTKVTAQAEVTPPATPAPTPTPAATPAPTPAPMPTPAANDTTAADRARATMPSPSVSARGQADTTMASNTASSVRPNAAADTNANASSRRSSLPATASPLPMIGLFGLISLFAGVAVATMRRKA